MNKEIWPVMLTPFTEEGAVDFDSLERLIAWYEKGGVSGLFAVCQSSEMFSLSLRERLEIALRTRVGGPRGSGRRAPTHGGYRR